MFCVVVVEVKTFVKTLSGHTAISFDFKMSCTSAALQLSCPKVFLIVLSSEAVCIKASNIQFVAIGNIHISKRYVNMRKAQAPIVACTTRCL